MHNALCLIPVLRLELGAGGGLVGLALAIALAPREDDTHVHITDQISMLELMKQNIKLNDLPPRVIHASILNWGDSSDQTIQPDIVLAADCVYFEPAFPLLLSTLSHVMKENTVCYFCFKKRRKADMRFLRDCRKEFCVQDIQDDPDKEVWSRQGLFLYIQTARYYNLEISLTFCFRLMISRKQ